MTAPTLDSHRPPRVLLCEDEGLTIMMLRKTLRSHNYVIAGEAATAEEAIRIATESPLDLVIMDIDLQGPTNGIEAARRILSECFVPVVMLTAFVDQAHMRMAFDAGACGFIGKPITSRSLVAMVKAILSHTPRAQHVADARERFNAITLALGMRAVAPVLEQGRPQASG